MKTALKVLTLVLLTLVCVGNAAAEQSEAERLYKAGADAYFQNDYSKAIINFKRGHELDPNSMFLYNLSLAYAKLGNLEEAASHATQADEMGLPKSFADKNSARLIAFGASLNVMQIADAVAAEPAPEGYCEDNSACDAGERCDGENNVCVAEESNDDSRTFSTLGWVGVGVAAAGVVALGGALVIDLGLSSDIEAYDKAVADGDDDQAKELLADIESRQSTGQIMFFTGVGLAAGGTALLIYDFMSKDEGQTAWLPMFEDGHVGLSFGGRF